MQAISILNYLEHLIKSFNWHTPTWDLFIMLFWLVAGVVYAFAAGRGRLLTILMSVYIAKLLVVEAPFLTTELSKHTNIPVVSLQQMATFGVIFLVLFFFLGRYGFKSAMDGRHLSSLPFSIIFGILQIGLLISVVIGFLPSSVVGSFDPLIRFVFVENWAPFFWLVTPLVFLIGAGKFVTDRSEV